MKYFIFQCQAQNRIPHFELL